MPNISNIGRNADRKNKKTPKDISIKKENYDKTRRIKRGLFKTKTGKIINSDINGSLNILRKYVKSFSPNLEIAMDIGREQRPLKKRVA